MTIVVQGRIGMILLLILGLVVGIGILVGFALPSVLVGVWLVIGCILALIGV